MPIRSKAPGFTRTNAGMAVCFGISIRRSECDPRSATSTQTGGILPRVRWSRWVHGFSSNLLEPHRLPGCRQNGLPPKAIGVHLRFLKDQHLDGNMDKGIMQKSDN